MNEYPDTGRQFDEVIKRCRKVFLAKMKDYGSSWRILRPSSLTDQIFIKASRIRSIEEKRKQKIEEGIRSEYIGIVNYSVISLIQLEWIRNENLPLSESEVEQYYDKYILAAKTLMLDKNHDYGEAWRNAHKLTDRYHHDETDEDQAD